MQWRQTSIVRRGGVVEIHIPELAEGEAVDVTVRPAHHDSPDPAPGIFLGNVKTTENFDRPLDEFGKDAS